MSEHFHTGLENVIFYGLSAILVINITRFVAAKMAKSNNPSIAGIGSAIGATVQFG